MKNLGIDLGTNSIGWAVLEQTNEFNAAPQFELLHKGVHLFDTGVNIDSKGKSSSKAAERSAFRRARKLKFRRKLRKYETLKALIAAGMCPLPLGELMEWRSHVDPVSGKQRTFKRYPTHPPFLHWLNTDNEGDAEDRKAGTKNPYYYRDLASRKKLDLSQLADRLILGRALYHLAQRRGFLSNRLDGGSEDTLQAERQNIQDIIDTAEDKRALLDKPETKGVVTQGIDALDQRMAAGGFTTLGQYFHHQHRQAIRIRQQYTDREKHYLAEFEAICTMQGLDGELVRALRRAIFFQRPLKSQKGTIGRC
ncbi:MAG: hypothetical protein RLZZ165_2120, partial [Bacteroidota bacterium]